MGSYRCKFICFIMDSFIVILKMYSFYLLFFRGKEEFYGIGKVRSLSKFYETLGIDVLNRKMPRNLCEFVNSGEMHRTFYQGLKPDGMGIDYNKIDYKFQPIYENNKPKPNNLGK